MKWLTFNSLTLENPFVYYFNKRHGTRQKIPGSFRGSPLSFPDASLRTGLVLWKQLSTLNIEARACYHNTNMLMSLCYPPPRWMNELLWESCQVTLPWGKCPSVFPVSQSRTETYQVLAARYRGLPRATLLGAEALWTSCLQSESINSIPTPSFCSGVLVFIQKLKSSEWTCTTHFEWGTKTSVCMCSCWKENIQSTRETFAPKNWRGYLQ